MPLAVDTNLAIFKLVCTHKHDSSRKVSPYDHWLADSCWGTMTVPKAADNKKSDTVADPIRQSNRVAASKAKATTVTPGNCCSCC